MEAVDKSAGNLIINELFGKKNNWNIFKALGLITNVRKTKQPKKSWNWGVSLAKLSLHTPALSSNPN